MNPILTPFSSKIKVLYILLYIDTYIFLSSIFTEINTVQWKILNDPFLFITEFATVVKIFLFSVEKSHLSISKIISSLSFNFLDLHS